MIFTYAAGKTPKCHPSIQFPKVSAHQVCWIFLKKVFVPANCTNGLQPLDISVNKPAKNFMRARFQEWYAEQILQQVQGNMEKKPVDLKLSIVKSLAAKWFIQLSDYLQSKPDIIRNGFKGAGITAAYLKG